VSLIFACVGVFMASRSAGRLLQPATPLQRHCQELTEALKHVSYFNVGTATQGVERLYALHRSTSTKAGIMLLMLLCSESEP
jgi:hypothetical protein